MAGDALARVDNLFSQGKKQSEWEVDEQNDNIDIDTDVDVEGTVIK